VHCPIDKHDLIEYADGGQPIWRCNICSGAFVHANAVVDGARAESPKERPFWDTEVSCPTDSAKMFAFSYRDVTVHVCASCRGVWLDGGEIEKVLGHTLPGDSTIDSAAICHMLATFIVDVLRVCA